MIFAILVDLLHKLLLILFNSNRYLLFDAFLHVGACLDVRAVDENGYILDVEITAGNVHDSVAFELYYERLIEEFPQIEATPHMSHYSNGDIEKLPTRTPGA